MRARMRARILTRGFAARIPIRITRRHLGGGGRGPEAGGGVVQVRRFQMARMVLGLTCGCVRARE